MGRPWFRNVLVASAWAVWLGIASVGCGDDGGGGGGDDDEDFAAVGVQVVHLAPDVDGPVDVLIDGEEVPGLTGLGLGDGTAFLDLGPGPFDVSVVPAGTDGPPILTVPGVTLTAARTLLAVIDLALDGSDADLDLASFRDDRAPPDAGLAGIRVFHLAPELPSVGIDLAGERVISGLMYLGGSEAVAVPPGELVMGVDFTDEPGADAAGTLPAVVGDRLSSVFLFRVPADPSPTLDALVTDDRGRLGEAPIR